MPLGLDFGYDLLAGFLGFPPLLFFNIILYFSSKNFPQILISPTLLLSMSIG